MTALRINAVCALVVFGGLTSAACAGEQQVGSRGPSGPGEAEPKEAVTSDRCGGSVAKPETRYLKESTGLLMPAGLKRTPQGMVVPNDTSRYPNLIQSFAKNTKFEVLRRLPGEDGQCMYVEVKPSEWNDNRFTFISKAEWLTDTPKSEKEMDADRDAKNRAIQERLDAEVQAGRCDDKHVEHLRRVLESSKQMFASQTGSFRDPNVWDVVGHKLVVATDKPEAFGIDLVLGGELHVFALGYGARTKLHVEDGQGYPVKNESDYVTAIHQEFRLNTHGVQFAATAGEKIKATISGRGCVLFFVVRRN